MTELVLLFSMTVFKNKALTDYFDSH
jgi:hypothetical protein